MNNNSISEVQLNSLGVSLHRAIIDQLVGGITAAIDEGRIRSNGADCSVYDFVREILKKKGERKVWERFTENVPDIVRFCHFISFSQKSGRMGRKTPVTDIAGLIWIAYIDDSDFSFQLRTSSAQLILAERQSSPLSQVEPIADIVESLERSLEAAHTALNSFPFTLEKLHRDSGIVNKSQVKSAIIRDFIEGRDYIWADKLLCVNESTYHILMMSFRSLRGADISQLPDIIQVKTKEYFHHLMQKRMNRRTAQADNQPTLFDMTPYEVSDAD